MRTRAVILFGLGLAVGAVTSGCEGRPASSIFPDGGIAPTWVTINPGTFTMGSPSSETCREVGGFKETQHKVTLTHAFEISVTETTQGQYYKLMGDDPSTIKDLGPNAPVETVSWHEAVSYCNELSKAAGLASCYTCAKPGSGCENATSYLDKNIYKCPGYRLPTEAEWEYAARAGTTTAYYSGDETNCDNDSLANQIGWYYYNSSSTLQQTAQKEANVWGLYDMSGSVWEWVQDWFVEDLGSTAVTDPVGPASTSSFGRVLRGGSCLVAAKLLRSASRYNYSMPDIKLKYHGFRCVRTTK
jgi:formylglycine-generating enzyme